MSLNSIGISKRPAVEIFRSHGLEPFRKILTPDLFQGTTQRLTRAFTILIPEVVFWLMVTVALGDGAMAAAVMTFWSPIRAIFPCLPAEPVTEEAFCIARRLLPLAIFRRLFDSVASRFHDKFGSWHLWHGFRLWGVDGSVIDLPPSPQLREVFGTPSNGHSSSKHPQALLVGLVGLFNGLCRDFLLVPLKKGEQWCARALCGLLGPGDLLLMDRNFADYQSFSSVLHRGAEFLIRLPAKRFHRCKRERTPSGRRDEWYVTLRLPTSVRKAYPSLPPFLTLRILQYQMPGFRPSWLITSLLDTEKYPYEAIVSLYHERWRHETAYREWKHTLQISNLRSKLPQGILKELLVQLTLNNAIRWMQAEAGGPHKRPVDLQFLSAKRLIINFIPAMAIAPAKDLSKMHSILLKAIASKVILVRPGRSYPRPHDQIPRYKGNGIYARLSRLVKYEEAKRAVI